MPPLRHEPADERRDHRVRFAARARAGAPCSKDLPPAQHDGHGGAAQADGAGRARREVRIVQDDPSFPWDLSESTLAEVRPCARAPLACARWTPEFLPRFPPT